MNATTATATPSDARLRLPVVLLSLGGLVIATVLTLFQVGVLDTVWDPFFGDGSATVLTSSISQALPVPDAALGMVAYLAEAVLESIGGRDRWRRMPLLPIAAGVVAAGLSLVALGLIAAQVFLLGAFCTLCLASATISLLVAALVAPEVTAALRTLRQRPSA